jgi:AcrR family transcriptional regulator
MSDPLLRSDVVTGAVPATEAAAMPEPPWSSLRNRPARPVRRPLTRDAIIDAALRVVDTEGLVALSMRRLASELRVVPASLYGHVSGREELLQLLLDRVAGEIGRPPADPDDWQAACREFLRSLRSALVGHNDLASAAIGNIPTGPHWMKLVDGLLGLLVAGRMRPAAAAYASDLLIEHVITDVYEGALFAQRIEADPGYFDSLSQYLHALPADRFPNIAAMVDHLTAGGSGSGDARFEFGLDVIFHSLANATVATDDESTRAAVVRPVRGIHVPSTA